jgi:hypothetical protein
MTTDLKFPHDPLTALNPDTEPTPQAIRLLRQELYANARAIPSTLGGGRHGHLGLIMPPNEYLPITAGQTAFIVPIAAPACPRYSNNAPLRAQQKEAHRVACKAYTDALTMMNQLMAQMLLAVPPTYREILADTTHGYAMVTPMALLEHLLATYGTIRVLDVGLNLVQLEHPWDPETPIASVFVNARRCRQFAQEAEDPISDKTYMRLITSVFRKSGVLDEAVQEWNKLEPNVQTVQGIVTHFTAADKHRRENKHYLSELSSHQALLTAHQYLKEIQQAHTTALLHKGTDLPPKGFTIPPKTDSKGAAWCYCWSHGICKHHSPDCRYPKPGHKKEATMLDRQGGVENAPTFQANGDRARGGSKRKRDGKQKE